VCGATTAVACSTIVVPGQLPFFFFFNRVAFIVAQLSADAVYCLLYIRNRYGSWDQVRNSVRRCERFRFDFYLQSCSADALGKR
jgi:hypothetical protein